MFIINKQFSFSASHILEGLPAEHPCGRLHGHNYVVELTLASTILDKTGFVLDYNDLDQFKRIIDSELDHRHLNDVLRFQPSAENIAKYLYDCAKKFCPALIAVRVSETPKTWAEFRE